jgi:hypothetical protein
MTGRAMPSGGCKVGAVSFFASAASIRASCLPAGEVRSGLDFWREPVHGFRSMKKSPLRPLKLMNVGRWAWARREWEAGRSGVVS